MDATLWTSQAMHKNLQASTFDDWMRARHLQEASTQEVELDCSPTQNLPKMGHALVCAEPITRPAKQARTSHLRGGVVGSLHQCGMVEVAAAQGSALPTPTVRLEEIALEAFDGVPTRNNALRRGEQLRPSFAAMAKLGADIRSKHEQCHALERTPALKDAKTPELRQVETDLRSFVDCAETQGAELPKPENAGMIDVDAESGQRPCEHVQPDQTDIMCKSKTLETPVSDEHNIDHACLVGAQSASDANFPLDQHHASSEPRSKFGNHSESRARIGRLCTPPNCSVSSHAVIKSHKDTRSKQHVETPGESLTALGAKEVVAARITAIENDMELFVAKKRKAIDLMRMLHVQL